MSDESDDRIATPSQTVGPFFHVGLPPIPWTPAAGERAAPAAPVSLTVRVFDGDGAPVPDALVEVWSASGFGRQPTGTDGCCVFEMAEPRVIDICLFARGLLRQLHTRAYFGTDAALDDAALAAVPDARRHTVMARRDAGEPHRWVFDIRMQGQDETVFFDA